MSSGAASRSPSESPTDYDVNTEADVGGEVATTKGNSIGGSRRPSQAATFLNRRTKIANGNVDTPKDRKQAKRKKNRESGRINETMRRDKGRKSTDSGLGRTSVEDINSPSTDDLMRRKGWEAQNGESESGGGRHGEVERVNKGHRGVTAAKKEEMARLEKELEQEMRYR